MSIQFKSTPCLQDALHILDQTITLLSIILDYQITVREVKLIGNGETTAWLPNTKEHHGALDPSKWLVGPKEILPFFRKHIGSWLDSTKAPADLTLIKSVMHSRRPGSTIEGQFLSCCQSFEELSRRRTGRDKFDPSEFTKVRDSVLEFIDKMETKGEIKRKIKNAIKNSNSLTLSDRIRGAFKGKPYWKHEAKSKYKDIEGHIEKKRNELSHGNPTGFVQSQSDADLLFILRDYIFLHFLGETLILAGVDESQIGTLVSRSASCRNLLHALKRVKPV